MKCNPQRLFPPTTWFPIPSVFNSSVNGCTTCRSISQDKHCLTRMLAQFIQDGIGSFHLVGSGKVPVRPRLAAMLDWPASFDLGTEHAMLGMLALIECTPPPYPTQPKR